MKIALSKPLVFVATQPLKLARFSQSILKVALIKTVRFYQRFISPLFPPTCRFYPTCSQYFIDALEKKGIVRGVLLGLWRILRCQPFGKGGYDPVK